MQSQVTFVSVCKTNPDRQAHILALSYRIIGKNESMPAAMPAPTTLANINAENSKQNKPTKQMKMLLVEDSKLLRDILFDAISHVDNINVTASAATQKHAISLLDESQFDIVLLDIELAQGNGFEVIKHLQQDNYAFKKPILVMLTNHAHPHYRNLAKTLGVPYFFDKSMDFDLAIDAITLEANRFSKAPH